MSKRMKIWLIILLGAFIVYIAFSAIVVHLNWVKHQRTIEQKIEEQKQ